MRYLFLTMTVWLLVLSSVSAEEEAKVSITLPAESVSFRQGPGVELATSQCTTCHSPDYVYTQPPLSEEKWTSIVKKMKKAFGSQVADADIPVIVQYLVSQNGQKK